MYRVARTVVLLVLALVVTAISANAASAAPTSRIIGGTKPSPELYDQQLRSTVALVAMGAPTQFDGQFCGGTLIDDTHVLTAAHCIAETDPYTYRSSPGTIGVLAGTTQLNETAINRSQLVPVQTIFVHPFFNLKTFRYDAAILRLARPVTNVPTLPLLTDEESAALSIDTAEVPARAAGWGDQDTASAACCFPSSLETLVTMIHTADACRANLAGSPTWRFDAAHQVCSGAVNRDTCQGDSGGPLVVQVGGTPRLAGVVSHGLGCGEGFYGIYSKATALRGWIAAIPGTTEGDERDGSLGPDGSGAPTVTSAVPLDYSRVRLTVQPGVGPAPARYTAWLRMGPALRSEDIYLGAHAGPAMTLNLPPRNTTATYRVLVRAVTANGESPAGIVNTGPRLDRIAPTAPRAIAASHRSGRLTATWLPGTDAQGGVRGHEVQRTVNGRVQPVRLVVGVNLLVVRSARGTVRVRTKDWAGNVSAWSRPVAF